MTKLYTTVTWKSYRNKSKKNAAWAFLILILPFI